MSLYSYEELVHRIGECERAKLASLERQVAATPEPAAVCGVCKGTGYVLRPAIAMACPDCGGTDR